VVETGQFGQEPDSSICPPHVLVANVVSIEISTARIPRAKRQPNAPLDLIASRVRIFALTICFEGDDHDALVADVLAIGILVTAKLMGKHSHSSACTAQAWPYESEHPSLSIFLTSIPMSWCR